MGVCNSTEQPRAAHSGFVSVTKSSAQEAKPAQRTQFNVIFVGDSGVGKTSLILRMCDNTFSESYTSTIGVDFVRLLPIHPKKLTVASPSGSDINLHLWDTAGQERFRTIVTTYYRNAHACILVYDVTKKTSFENVSQWLTELKRNHHQPDRLMLMLLGNKADLEGIREVSKDQGKAFAQKNGMLYFEVSAKEGRLVQDSLTQLAHACATRSAAGS